MVDHSQFKKLVGFLNSPLYFPIKKKVYKYISVPYLRKMGYKVGKVEKSRIGCWVTINRPPYNISHVANRKAFLRQ